MAGRIETTPATLELFAQSLCASDRVVLEVTANAWEIARIIEPHAQPSLTKKKLRRLELQAGAERG